MGAIRFLSTCFIWFPCGLPIWVPDPAHSFHRSCPQFRPYGPHTVFVHLFHMGPMWVANMQYGSHVGCQYAIWVSCGLPIWVPDPAHIFPGYCPHFCPVGAGTVLVRLFQRRTMLGAQLGSLILVKKQHCILGEKL